MMSCKRIRLVVKDSADESSYVPVLEAAGYVLQIREPDWFEHRLYKGPDTDINLHVFSLGTSEIDRMLRFRDCCGLMILIGTNMHKSNEAWQRINGGMSSTMRMLKHQ